ncbi:MAG: hypothetical protein Q8O56_10670 [Solirubrobacteraceae bacterium]|nr:hypothetical protein [Solirubrobacteraceae bacterium]
MRISDIRERLKDLATKLRTTGSDDPEDLRAMAEPASDASAEAHETQRSANGATTHDGAPATGERH